MNEITCNILDSINEIKRDDWDLLFGDEPEGYQFFKTIEESRLSQFVFHYLVLSRGNKVILIAPLFVADFNLDIAVEGFLSRLINYVRVLMPRFLIVKTLFCGSPFGEHGILGISREEDKHRLVDELRKRIEILCKEKSIPLVMFKDFLKEETRLLDRLLLIGFFRVNSFPSASLELSCNSLEQYINELGSSTRKNLRRRLKKAYLDADIRIEVVDRIDNIAGDIYRLYENAYKGGSTKFELINPEFFVNIGPNLSPHAKFFLYYVNGRLAAFNLCFIYKNLFIDKFIGFDYDMSRKYSLYFVSWCVNVEWCLKNSLRFYVSGQTDYSPKMRLGAKLIPLYVYLRHQNPVMNFLLRALSIFMKPEDFDQDIKNNKDV